MADYLSDRVPPDAQPEHASVVDHVHDAWRVYFRNQVSDTEFFIVVGSQESALRLACAKHRIATVLHIVGPNSEHMSYEEIIKWSAENRV
jgi:hypothetical protein